MLRFRKAFALLLVVLCICASVFSVSAAPATSSKAAGEFGTITGTLSDSGANIINGNLLYLFSYRTAVTKLPGSSARLLVGLDLKNNSTGATIDSFTDYGCYTPGYLWAGYDYELDHISNIRGANGITVAVFGCHEARYTNAYAVYTQKTYNLYRDHGIL